MYQAQDEVDPARLANTARGNCLFAAIAKAVDLGAGHHPGVRQWNVDQQTVEPLQEELDARQAAYAWPANTESDSVLRPLATVFVGTDPAVEHNCSMVDEMLEVMAEEGAWGDSADTTRSVAAANVMPFSADIAALSPR